MFDIIVYGDPVSKGSTRAFVPKGWKRAVVTAANPKTKIWEKTIRDTCSELSLTPDSLPWRVRIKFAMKRPQKMPKGRTHHTVKPDLDKLTRCVLDALTGIAWVDDAQVVSITAVKTYCSGTDGPHVRIKGWSHG